MILRHELGSWVHSAEYLCIQDEVPHHVAHVSGNALRKFGVYVKIGFSSGTSPGMLCLLCFADKDTTAMQIIAHFKLGQDRLGKYNIDTDLLEWQ